MLPNAPSKILVACPNHVIKEYSFQRWIDNVTSLTYPNYDILVVDSSLGGELAEKYGNQVPIVMLDAVTSDDSPDARMARVNMSMEVIRTYFLEGDYSHWMNIESDVIPPPDVIEVLLDWGRTFDWVAHAYPHREDELVPLQGIGCSLLSRRLMETFGWEDSKVAPPDALLWSQVSTQTDSYPKVELYGIMKVSHLATAEARRVAALRRLARKAKELEDES